MQVVILCGGKGTRLREETELRPKPMVYIGDRPILWHIMKLYAHYGHNEFILCLGYKGEVIKNYFLNYQALTSDFTLAIGRSFGPVFHNSPPEEGWTVTLADTGLESQTGARVSRIRKYIRGDRFMLTYGDGLSDLDINKLIQFHLSHGKIGTVTGVRPPSRFGELGVDANGRVYEFNEKPQATAGLINGGFFVFERAIFDYLSDDESLVLEREPLQKLARDGQMVSYEHTGFWQPMDTYREYEYLNHLWATGKAPWKVWSS